MIRKFKTFSRVDAAANYADWTRGQGRTLPSLDNDYSSVRNSIKELFERVRNHRYDQRTDYNLDVHFGMELYLYLKDQKWFNLRTASDDGFWRYLSINVLPDIVAERWSFDNEERYWKRPARIWLRAIWWNIHYSWSIDENVTIKMLESQHFNTDTVMNLVERTGRKGIEIEVYRSIVLQYSKLSIEDIRTYARSKNNDETLFRAVMKLNTARLLVVEPSLNENGVDGYVKSLFDVVLKNR